MLAEHVTMNMRTISPLVLIALLAVPAFAQEKPDYSKENLLRILSVDIGKPEHERNVTYEFGAINFTAFGQRFRYSYLPFLAPLQGSRFNHVTTSEWPDPFVLTNTQIAMRPGTYRERRARTAELRRIDRITRRKAKVVVNP